MPRWWLPRHPRLRAPHWPLLLLVAAIGATTVAALDARRAVRSHERIARQALTDYASFAAWSYQQHLRVAITEAIREVLGPVQHGHELHRSPGIPHARELAHYLPWNDDCYCHRPRYGPVPAAFFGFTLGTDTLGAGINTSPHPDLGWTVDPPPPEGGLRGAIASYTTSEKRFIIDTVTTLIRTKPRSEWFYWFIVGEHAGRERYLAFTTMPTAWGDTIVYGTEYTGAEIHAMLAELLDQATLLPSTVTASRTNAEMLAIEVVARGGGGGTPLFASQPGKRWDLDASHPLPPSFGGMIVHAQIRPELASTLVIGGLPRSRVPLMLGLLAVAAALSVVSLRQLRREGELSRLRTDFVSSVSHELRTPLTQMRVYLETLRLGRFTTGEQRAHSLALVEREVRRLSHLVENVLRFSSRSDAGGPRETVVVAAEVEQIVTEFAPIAESRRSQVFLDIEPDSRLLVVELRAGALRQIVLNLLDNAVKYGPSVQSIGVRVSRGQGVVRVTVEDEGPGVPEAERARIWEAFQRGSAASASGAGGSGIGLTIVRELVVAHGGRVNVGSAPRGGAQFVIELPVGACPAEAPASARVPLPTPRDTTSIDPV
jgi:signal transduction histidine kinase